MQGRASPSWTANPSIPFPSMELEPELAPPPPPLPVVVNGAGGPNARRIVAAHRLPLRASPDPSSPFGFAFSIDADAVAFQLSRGLPAPVTFVGTLPAAAAESENLVVPSDELDAYLMEHFSCLPVHLDGARHSAFYDDFCKRYLWPLLHHLPPPPPPPSPPPISPVAAAHVGDDLLLRFDGEAYRAFVAANAQFASRVVEVLSPDDGDLVVVHDYHLWVLPTFLRRKCPRAGVGFFLHSPFPSTRLLAAAVPVRDDLLRGLLNADLVGFQNPDYARDFLSSCSLHLGLSVSFSVSGDGDGGGGGASGETGNGGGIIKYHGRNVVVKTLSVGLDMGRLRAALAAPEAAAKAKEIAEAYRGRTLIVGVDDVDMFKGVKLKLLAMEKMLETHAGARDHVVLVQINNQPPPRRRRDLSADDVRRENEQILRRINARFSRSSSPAVVMIDGPVTMAEKAAYYAAADCCVVSAVRDGLNRVPYFYTACREEFVFPFPFPIPGGGGGARTTRQSAVVVSRFAGCSPTLGGAIRVDPWDVDRFADAMHAAVTTMSAEEKRARHRRNYEYLRAHDAVAWAQAFDGALRRACKDHATTCFVGLGFGMSYRAAATTMIQGNSSSSTTLATGLL